MVCVCRTVLEGEEVEYHVEHRDEAREAEQPEVSLEKHALRDVRHDTRP